MQMMFLDAFTSVVEQTEKRNHEASGLTGSHSLDRSGDSDLTSSALHGPAEENSDRKSCSTLLNCERAQLKKLY